MSIIVFADGVIRTDTRVPIFEGISVYHALNADAKVTLAFDDEEEAERWCREHKFLEVDDILSNDKFKFEQDKNFAKVKHLQSQGPVFLVVTADLDLAKKCIEHGVRVFLFLHPKYISHKFRPDSREGIRSWAAIQEELDRQIELRSEDKRA